MIAAILLLATATVASSETAAQTPPVRPNTTDIVPPAGIVLPPPAKPAIPGTPLSAAEAVQLAFRHSPIIRAAQANETVARGRLQQVEAGRLPSLSLTSAYNHAANSSGTMTSNAGGGGSSEGYSNTVALKQLLFDDERTQNLVSQARAQEKVAQLALGQAQNDLAQNVKAACYALRESEGLVAVNEENVKSRVLQVRYAKARLESGLGAPADVVQATTNYDDALQALTTARTTEVTARIQLASLLGLDPRTPVAVADTEERETPAQALEDLVLLAQRQRPEAGAAQLQVEAAKSARNAAESGNAPTVSFTVSTGAKGDSNPFDTRTTTLGIAATWNLYDSGATAGAVKQAEGALAQAEAQASQVALNVTAEVSQAYVQLQAVQQRLAVVQAEEKNATESVRLAEGRYKAGIGIFLEVTNAQASLVQARTAVVNATADLSRARVALRHAIGEAP